MPAARKPPTPVALWLYPAPVAIDRRESPATPTPAENREGAGKSTDATDRRRQAQREDMPDGSNGLNLLKAGAADASGSTALEFRLVASTGQAAEAFPVLDAAVLVVP